MKTYIKLSIMLSVLWFSAQAQTQQQSSDPKKFSLQEAVDYAKKNNYALRNNLLDVTASEKKVKEILASGLPQINASGNFTNYLQIPTQVLPNFINDALPPGMPKGPAIIQARFGQPFAATGSITANQLLFDGAFIMGVKASKEFINLSRLNLNRNEIETEVSVSKAYYAALLLQTNVILIDTNIATLEKAKNDLEKMYANGLAEKTDYDRIRLQHSTLVVQRDRVINQYRISVMLLELQMGMNVGDSILLTDKLIDLYKSTKSPAVPSKMDYNSRVEYKALDQQQRLYNYDKRRYEFGYAPTLNGFFTHQQNSFGTSFSQLGNTWYPGTLWGLNLSIPIFDGLRKSAQIQQSKINILKAENDKKNLANSIDQQIAQSKMNFELASRQVTIQQENLALAQEIYDRINIKYENGLGSSLDLTNAQNDLETARQNFLTTVFDYFSAQLELRKAIGDIK